MGGGTWDSGTYTTRVTAHAAAGIPTFAYSADVRAGLLAMHEGGLDLDEVAEELAEAGFDKAAIESTSKTLATVGAGSGGAFAKTDGDLGVDEGSGADRL